MEELVLSIEQGIAYITLNRPEKYNSVNRSLALAFQEALDTCAKDDSIRCLVITAAGKAFCAGQDLGEAIDKDGPGLERILKEGYNPLIQAMRNLPIPIVCAVNGVAAGAGANIALACDILVANDNASFIQAFTKIGLIPDSGGTYFLPKIIGTHRAMAQMLLADKVSASEAKEIGLIHAVYSAELFMEETMKLAQRLADMPTQALAFTKQAVYAGWNNTLEEQLELELELQIKAGNTEDHQEGISAFLEKRTPQFSGK